VIAARQYSGRSRRRVAITGVGAVTPIGCERDGLWRGVQAGVSAVALIQAFDTTGFPTRIAAEVRGFDARTYLPPKLAHRLDRYASFALAAAIMAVADSGLPATALHGERAGVCLGSALAGAPSAESERSRFDAGGLRAVSPLLALSVFGASASTNIAMHFGCQGANVCNANGCAAGAVALGQGFRAVRDDEADVVLAGASEAPLAPLSFGAFANIRAMSTRNETPAMASRPFDRDRDGFVMGEGAAILVLEEWEHALRRGATPLAEVAGFAQTCDAHHMTAPLPDGSQAVRAMRTALTDAGLTPEDVEYVKAHASATPLNDATEAGAIRAVLGERTARVPVNATKGMHGHALGASGAIEAAIVVLAMQAGSLPPTVNCDQPDPACGLDIIQQRARAVRPRVALCNSFGFGGINAALVLRRVD
jgi:3-oxoacyl-[acyl-carrier-protein] synthase II